LAEYGQLDWWPAEGPFEVMVGAVLTQRTAWANVERALERLRSADVRGPEALLAAGRGRLEAIVRPSGTYRQKAARLLAMFEEAAAAGGLEAFLALPHGELRARLLSVKGIGPETADSIVLYAAGGPAFVVDAYTRRLLGRLGSGPAEGAYDEVAAWFTRRLPRDVALYGNCHAVIVEHCKRRCRARPLCGGCPLYGGCPSALTPTGP
jgi:endonuclease-3 related protein